MRTICVTTLDPWYFLGDAQLFILPSGQSKSEVFASSEKRFYSKIVNAQITFNKDEDGKVISLTLHQNGDHLAKRVE